MLASAIAVAHWIPSPFGYLVHPGSRVLERADVASYYSVQANGRTPVHVSRSSKSISEVLLVPSDSTNEVRWLKDDFGV